LRFRAEDLAQSTSSGISLHEFGLAETIMMAKQLHCAPREVVIFGIKPSDISPGLGLTPEITKILPRIIELVLEEIKKTALQDAFAR
jgi:hydrogenase maturation protease